MGDWSYVSFNNWLNQDVRIVTLVIFLSVAFVYNKVFRMEQLSFRQSLVKHLRALRNRQFLVLGKTLLIYFLIYLGSLMLTFFQLMGLPIIISLAIAILLMLIVRIRYWLQGMQSNKQGGSS